MELMTVNPWFLLAYAVYLIVQCIVQVINARSVGKKISSLSLCGTCAKPVVDGDAHDCALSDDELQALTQFVALLKSHKAGDN